MTQRLIRAVIVLAALVAGTRGARASVSVSPNPVAEGAAAVGGTPATRAFTVSESAGSTTDVLDLDLTAAGCAQFTVSASPITVTMASPQMVTATYTPTARGAASCTVTLRNHSNGNPVTTFSITGTGTGPALTVTPTPANFGSVRVTTSAIGTQMLTLKNSGESDLELDTFAFATGTDYSITTAPTLPLVLGAGTTAAVTLQFKPTAPGTRTDTFSIGSTAVGAPATSVPLTGVGTNAQISAGSLDFGTVVAGTANTGTIVITNTGPIPIGPLAVTQAVLADTSGWFGYDASTGCAAGQPTCALGLTVNTTANFKMTCTPPAGASGAQTAIVTFTSDADAQGTGNVSTLTCTAGSPEITLVPPTTALAFGNVPVNTSSPAQSFAVHNGGTTTLSYTTAVSGAGYTLTSAACTPCTIAAGAADKTVSVKLTPNAIGDAPGTLMITDNDPDPGDAAITITLDGTGTASQIAITPATLALAYGNVDIGKSSSLVVTAQNNGNATLNISGAVLAGGGSAAYTVTDGTLTAQALAPGTATTWTLECTPTVTTQKTATFTITSDSLSNATAALTLTCTGQTGNLAVAPTSFNYMAVREGDTSTAQFTLSNTGNATVTGITAALSNAAIGYAIVTPPPASLPGGGSAMVTVTFNPTSAADGGADTLTLAGAWGSAPQTPTTATVSLTGTDAPAGFSLSTATLPFGDIGWNATPSPTQTFTISLTDPTPIKINSIDVAPDLTTTQTGEIAVVQVQKNGTTVPLPISPITMSGSDSVTVKVQAAPAARLGPLQATITVTSDLVLNPARTVLVTANSVSPAVALNPMTGTLDFGQVDVDGSPVTQTIILTNSGDAPLTIGAVTTTNPNNVFTFALPPATQTTIAPQASISVQVTYTPVLEEMDAGTVVVPVSGVFGIANGGQTTQTINIKGQGINRHIAVASTAVVFPPTFRYPSPLPQQAVHVSNTGLAPLHVQMVEVTGSSVFAVTDSSMVTIGGGSSNDFIVTFDPLSAGPAPEGQLLLVNDDTPKGQPDATAVITLDGMGIDRDVAMGPMTIELGSVGIGIPRRLSDLLPGGVQITSMDATNTFHIQSVTVDDTAHFTLLDAPMNVDLPPDGSASFDIEFAPSDPGDFTTTVSLYVDMDPDPTANVMVHGTGVFVDAHGGGGCSTSGSGGGGGGAGALLVAGVLAGSMRRRRRRRRRAAGLGAVAALGMLGVAHADTPAPTRDLDASVFHPMPSTGGDLFGIQSAHVGAAGDFAVSALLSYADKPLDLDTGTTDDFAIASRTLIDLGGAYAFLGNYEVAAHMPLYTQSGDAEAMDHTTGVSEAPTSGTARGDLAINGKANLWRSAGRGVELGAALGLTLPTATADQFAGVSKPELTPLLLATFSPDAAKRLALHVNAGGVLRERETYANIDEKSGLVWGAGVTFRALDALWLDGEAFGELIPGGVRTGAPSMKTGVAPSEALDAMEFLVGAHYRVERRTSIGFAIGRGLDAAFGTPSVRGVFSMTFLSGQPALPPIHPPPPPKIDGDADGDGVPDSVDKCPNDPEDRDGFEDEDGCPDPDNDHDGIPDATDKCPLAPEDKDGFQDEDGCPDLDNDHDGILDDKDKCPNDPEDKDGFQDGDGCPDPDNDKDGIPDVKDKCPNQPETINGIEDEDGCPDKGDSLVVVSPDRLDLLDSMKWNGVNIAKSSFNLLGQIAATLRAHDEIVRIRVTVYVQPSGNAARDKAITEKRAKEVRDWLIQWGIGAKRLEAKGFGGTKPLVAPDKRGAAALNDRLEMIILEKN